MVQDCEQHAVPWRRVSTLASISLSRFLLRPSQRNTRYEQGDEIMKKRTGMILLGIGVLIVLWALFRPEKLFVNQRVNESLPTAAVAPTSASSLAPAALLTGQFQKGAHETTGMASIYQLDGNKRVLRLTNFKTSNGPDVRVYLVAANDAMDSETVKKAGFLELGSLKGNEGVQNYDVPANADLTKYRAVTIWCARFNVNFGTAPLVRQ